MRVLPTGIRLVGLLLGLLSGTAAYANPQGADVVHGQVNFLHPNASTLNITNSPGSIINWQQFSIQHNEITRFIQESTSSAVLNRVVGQDPSSVLGQLLSNGRVFVINPNGIVFGQDAVIDTAGLIASTLDMSDEDFINGNLTFQGDAAADIQNKGYIKAGADGNIFLIAPNIENGGIIETDGGQIILAAGESVTIAGLDSDHIVFDVQASENKAVNLGEIITNGGAAQMFAGTIKHSGSVNADSIGIGAGGNIVLSASRSITLENGSTLSAAGGDVRLIAETDAGDAPAVIYQHGNIDVSGVIGGDIEFVADNVLHAGDLFAEGEQQGGSIKVRASGQILALAKSLASVNSRDGSAGQISITAETSLFTSASYSASGFKGGAVQLLGSEVKVAGASVDASGMQGGGRINVGGGYQGKDDNIRNAARTMVNADASFTADATASGDGGQVIVWADDETYFTGSISVRGGENGGNGGFVEVSGKESLKYGGDVDLRAPAGELGTLLLDPKNISVSGSGTFTVSDTEIVSPNVANFNQFGQDPISGKAAVELNNGNLLLIDFNSDFGGSNAGAVYIFNAGGTALIGSILGATAFDQVGNGGVTVLTNGNFVISSPDANLGASDTGAVSLHDGATGEFVNGGGYGVVSTGNSLTGNSGDRISENGITALSNGNYVVRSGRFNSFAGAVTLGDGVNGTTGVVSSSNSITLTSGSITELSNGNFVIAQPGAGIGGVNSGAVTLVNGSNGEFAVGGGFGNISSSNSLIGSASDRVGFSGVFALPNGDYVVASRLWNSSTGVVSQMDGSTGQFVNGGGITGITTSNSITGGITLNDETGNDVIVLNNGNYVVGSPDAGAATLINGSNGQFVLGGGVGAITPGNSFLMNNPYDQFLGTYKALTALNSGNYVFTNPQNNVGGLKGSVVLMNGVTGAEVGRINGYVTDIEMGDGGVYELTNGNYIILSIDAGDNGSTGDFMGTILADGTTGLEIGRALDLDAGSTGTNNSAFVLSNGNYLELAPEESTGVLSRNGIVRLMDGTTGLEIARIEGDDNNDRLGDCFQPVCAYDLNNGYFVVSNPVDIVGGLSNVGSVIVVDSSTGVEVDRVQGTSTSDSFGGEGIVPLGNGDFVVLSPNISSAPSTFEGRMHVVSVGIGATSDTLFANTPGTDATLSVASIKAALEGGNLVLQSNNDFILAADNDLLVANAGAGGSLTIKVGRSVILNSNIVTDNGDLTIIANETLANGVVTANRDPGAAVITMAPGMMIDAGTGNVVIDLRDGAGRSGTQALRGMITLADIYANTVTLAGGVVDGVGTITADVNNTGATLAPGASPGTLIINGNYMQGANGILQIELGGLTQGISYDLLSISGTATLDGTLDLILFGGFTESPGDRFNIIASSSLINDFATINDPFSQSFLALPDVPSAGAYRIEIPSIPTAPPPSSPPPSPPPSPPVTVPADDPPTVVADDDLVDTGTDQLVVLNAYQDNILVSILDQDADDEDARELICR